MPAAAGVEAGQAVAAAAAAAAVAVAAAAAAPVLKAAAEAAAAACHSAASPVPQQEHWCWQGLRLALMGPVWPHLPVSEVPALTGSRLQHHCPAALNLASVRGAARATSSSRLSASRQVTGDHRPLETKQSRGESCWAHLSKYVSFAFL